VDNKGWTPLHFAASNDQAGSARLLMNRGAVMSIKGLLFYYLRCYQNACVLIEGTQSDANGLTPLDIATQNNSSVVKSLLSSSK